jgi:hypothetical protein
VRSISRQHIDEPPSDARTVLRVKFLGDHVVPGTRVKVVRDPDWPWPSEPTGTIEPGWDIPFSVIDLAKRPDIAVPDSDRYPMRTFMVRFDEPSYDTSEDGPYYMAEVWEKYLRLVDP